MSEGPEIETLNQLNHKWLLGLVRVKSSWHFPWRQGGTTCRKNESQQGLWRAALLGEMAVGYFLWHLGRSKAAAKKETRSSVISVLDLGLPNRSWDSLVSAVNNFSTYQTRLQLLLHLWLQNVSRQETSPSYLLPLDNKTSHQVLWEREGKFPSRGGGLLLYKHHPFLVIVLLTFSGMALRLRGAAAAQAERLPSQVTITLRSSKTKTASKRLNR